MDGCTSETNNPPFETTAWDGKFRFGACSTLISSAILKELNFVVGWLQDPVNHQHQLDEWLPKVAAGYNHCSFEVFEARVNTALSNQGTSSIFDESRDYCRTNDQNAKFIDGMAKHPEFKPIDNFYDEQRNNDVVQFNVHRGLYHNAYGIPQNSVAAVYNAYLAGIRSVEFDVLETKDFVSIVLHDLVTNRLDGSFDAPPKYAALWDFAQLRSTPLGILNPLGEVPEVTKTEACNLVTTRDLLWAVRRWMPELTLYADARNSAPVSLLKLLHDEPDLRPNLVMKVYPYELGGGVYDIIKEYARRYTDGDEKRAAFEVKEVGAKFLLAMNSLMDDVAERVTLAETMDLTSTFAWDTRVKGANWLSMGLPFATDSLLKPKNGAPSYNKPWGHDLFTVDEMRQIQGRTYLATCWVINFSTIGNVQVFQIGLTPSLVGLIDSNDKEGIDLIPRHERLISAVTDNFIATYQICIRGELDVQLSNRLGHRRQLRQMWMPTVFGTADRFPDFAFAKRNVDGSVDQNSLINVYYNMTGTVYLKDDYAAKLMRSSQAIEAAMKSWPETLQGSYITTDLPTDLRTMGMGLSGTAGYPSHMDYRVGGIVKKDYYPIDGFEPKAWSTHLFGKLRRLPDFNQRYDVIIADLGSRKKLVGAIDSLRSYRECPVVIVNKRLLEVLNADGWYTGLLPESDYDRAFDLLQKDLRLLDLRIVDNQNIFAREFGVNFDGTPARHVTEVLTLPDANWDH